VIGAKKTKSALNLLNADVCLLKLIALYLPCPLFSLAHAHAQGSHNLLHLFLFFVNKQPVSIMPADLWPRTISHTEG
jgi:hypothetical protein